MVTFSGQSLEYLYVIDSGFAYAGIIIRDGRVVEAAPIFKKTFLDRSAKTAKWLIGKRGWKAKSVRPRSELRSACR